MRHTGILFALLLTGCSTNPIVDTMDFFHPGKLYPNQVDPYGGVCGPQGAVLAPGIGTAPDCPVPPIATVPGVVPPPVPLPPPAFPLSKPGL